MAESSSERNNWVDGVMAVLATIGVLTLIIGGSVLVRNALVDENSPRERVERVVPREEPWTERDDLCDDARGGGLFGTLDSDDVGDDFDAEAEFACRR